MTILPTLPVTDAVILARLVQSDQPDLASETAHALLPLRWDRADLDRLHNLTVKNQADELTIVERSELDSYLRISSFLDLMQAKARLSLRDQIKESSR